jgi:hypothetical protein
MLSKGTAIDGLLYTDTGKTVAVGDEVITSTNNPCTVRGCDGSTVYVTMVNGITKAGYYPQVLGMEWAAG